MKAFILAVASMTFMSVVSSRPLGATQSTVHTLANLEGESSNLLERRGVNSSSLTKSKKPVPRDPSLLPYGEQMSKVSLGGQQLTQHEAQSMNPYSAEYNSMGHFQRQKQAEISYASENEGSSSTKAMSSSGNGRKKSNKPVKPNKSQKKKKGYTEIDNGGPSMVTDNAGRVLSQEEADRYSYLMQNTRRPYRGGRLD
jgi:hypothetical protein